MKCCENPFLRRSKLLGVKAAHGNGLMDPRSGWGRPAAAVPAGVNAEPAQGTSLTMRNCCWEAVDWCPAKKTCNSRRCFDRLNVLTRAAGTDHLGGRCRVTIAGAV